MFYFGLLSVAGMRIWVAVISTTSVTTVMVGRVRLFRRRWPIGGGGLLRQLVQRVILAAFTVSPSAEGLAGCGADL